jgi:hypothetical protein
MDRIGSQLVEKLIYGLNSMKSVSRTLYRADVADGGAVDDSFGHLVDQGLGVLEANQAAEFF